jgi:ribosomal protein S18 acetylase RimI-like enzyme
MIREFRAEDTSALIQLFRLNTPTYFDVSEEAGYLIYLEKETEDYFVVEKDNQIIGTGGINYVPDRNEAVISWDILHPDYQGKGIGSKLLQFRIDLVRSNPSYSSLMVRTSQLTFKFYQKNGFDLEKVVEDYWAPGFDLYQMKMIV